MDDKARIALVTGASSGIGAATARALAANGFTVGIVARRADRLAEVLADCRVRAPDSRSFVADLADPDRAAALATEAWNAFGHLDVLVNNAGIPMRRPVPRLTMEDVERVMRVNYLSPVAMTLAVLPAMIERGGGTIVNVSSLGGRLGITTEAAYSASKFALCGFSEAMAADIDGTGVKVRLVLPGAIDTEIWDQPGNDAPFYSGPLTPAQEVADGIVEAINGDGFEHYLPDMKAVVELKTADFDGFLAGMLAVQKQPPGSYDATQVPDRGSLG
ncbi:MAG TPA: SDR family NAD(P)-dependent oxidoreductase [Acidimicrobiales bacterium]|jgi:short-subunit dehydrogenase|nr:SDR family NAD(P)-dependent oxidoreductase [Acidimicrobiales bacterium]